MAENPKLSMFTAEQNDVLNLILELHTAKIKEHITKAIEEMEKESADNCEKSCTKFWDEIDGIKKQHVILDKKFTELNTKFNIKSGIWGLMGGLIPGAIILAWILVKGI